MQELRFEDLRFTAESESDQIWLHRGLGAHELQIQLAVGVTPLKEAGQILALEAGLFGFGAGPSPNGLPLGRFTTSLAFTQVITVHRVKLSFLLTSLQLHAIEEGRAAGDIRFELVLNATLPQAVGYPGCQEAPMHFTIAKSRWEQQIAGLGPSTAFEMAVPYPLGDPGRDAVGRTLREAQRLITTGGTRAAILEVRRALEGIQQLVDWERPGKKAARECNQTERWWRIQDALYSQSSGALHNDEITRDFNYSRAEAETLLAMTAALMRNVPTRQN